MIDDIARQLQERWPELYPSSVRPHSYRYFVQSRHRVVFFLFDAHSNCARPVLVVKVARQPRDNDALEHSVEVIDEIRKKLKDDIRETLPRAVSLGRVYGLSCVAETYLPGQALEIPRFPFGLAARTRHNVSMFRKWLVRFQQQAQTDPRARYDQSTFQYIRRSLLSQSEGCVLTKASENCLDTLEERLVPFDLPRTWSYGDTHHSNILTHDGRVSGLVDWMGAASQQFPTMDWFQFAFEYARAYLHKTNSRLGPIELGDVSLRFVLGAEDNPLARVLREETGQFVQHLGLAGDLLPYLFVAFLERFWWPYGKPRLISTALRILGERQQLQGRC